MSFRQQPDPPPKRLNPICQRVGICPSEFLDTLVRRTRRSWSPERAGPMRQAMNPDATDAAEILRALLDAIDEGEMTATRMERTALEGATIALETMAIVLK